MNSSSGILNIKMIGSMLLIVVMITSIGGCFSDDPPSEDDQDLETKMESEIVTGTFDYPPTQIEQDIVGKIGFLTSYSNITSITLSIHLEDNDPNTEMDHVSFLEISDMNSNGENNAFAEINIGSDMPVDIEVNINSTEMEDKLFFNEWYIFVHGTLKPSEDQWIGPLIWRGWTDSGFGYSIDVSYEYVVEE